MSRNTVLSCFVVFPIAFVFAQSRVLQKHHWLVGRTADRCSESPPSPQCASATRTPQEDPLFVGQQWIPWTTDTRRSAATGGRRLRKDCWTFEPNVFRFFFLVSKSLQHEIPLLGALSLSSSASARKRRWKSSPAPGQVKQMPKLRPWSPRRFLLCSWRTSVYGGGRGFTGRCLRWGGGDLRDVAVLRSTWLEAEALSAVDSALWENMKILDRSVFYPLFASDAKSIAWKQRRP